MTRGLILFALLFTLACETGSNHKVEDQKTPETSQPEAKETEVKTEKMPESAPESAPAPSDDEAMKKCTQACVEKNQMRAVAADQLERDCRAECAQTQ